MLIRIAPGLAIVAILSACRNTETPQHLGQHAGSARVSAGTEVPTFDAELSFEPAIRAGVTTRVTV